MSVPDGVSRECLHLFADNHGVRSLGTACSVNVALHAGEASTSAPKATTVEKAATSTERSILLRIVGFVLT